MDKILASRVRAAAVAGWCTILIAVIWLTVGWLCWLVLFAYEPKWLITLWGGHVTWQEVHTLVIWFVAAAKLLLLGAVMVTIWLTIFARKLRRSGGA